jgi:hypothetical protein
MPRTPPHTGMLLCELGESSPEDLRTKAGGRGSHPHGRRRTRLRCDRSRPSPRRRCNDVVAGAEIADPAQVTGWWHDHPRTPDHRFQDQSGDRRRPFEKDHPLERASAPPRTLPRGFPTQTQSGTGRGRRGQQSPGTLLVVLIRARGSLHQLNTNASLHRAERAPDQLIADLRQHASSRKVPVVSDQRNVLFDVLVHTKTSRSRSALTCRCRSMPRLPEPPASGRWDGPSGPGGGSADCDEEPQTWTG